MTKILLHAGTHKTGTTTLQAALAGHRDVLAERGVYYPRITDFFPVDPAAQAANAHFALAAAIAGFGEADRERLAAFTRHLRAVSPDFTHVVLSAESLYRYMLGSESKPGLEDPEVSDADQRRMRAAYVARLAEVFAGFDVEVVLYFRRVDRFAESFYSEVIVSTRAARGFDEFLAIRPLYFDYRFQIDLFSRHFPVRVYGFEQKARDGLVESFFRDNGLGPAVAAPPALRASVPPQAVLWLRRAKKGRRMSIRERRRRWLFALQPQIAQKLFGAGTPASFWPDRAARDAFVARCCDAVPEIAFPALEPDIAPPCIWTGAMHRRAERRFLNWQERQADWIAAREAARTQPFIP